MSAKQTAMSFSQEARKTDSHRVSLMTVMNKTGDYDHMRKKEQRGEKPESLEGNHAQSIFM